MNIFYISDDPIQAAKWQVDKHVIKMPLETAQMLCTAHRIIDGSEYTELSKNNRRIKRWRLPNKFHDTIFYKATHVNHPSCAWIRQSDEHYRWAYEHFIALSNEYAQRYGKAHKSWEVLADYLHGKPANIQSNGFCPPPTAINEQYADCLVKNDTIQSYRNYYNTAKKDLHQWKQNKPTWASI